MLAKCGTNSMAKFHKFLIERQYATAKAACANMMHKVSKSSNSLHKTCLLWGKERLMERERVGVSERGVTMCVSALTTALTPKYSIK